MEYAVDADNWGGCPLVGGNVGGSVEDRGNLTDLKKAGLIETIKEGHNSFVVFTMAGKAFAKDHGIEIHDGT